MRRYKIYDLCFFLTLIGGGIYAQESVYFDRITNAEGAPIGHVFDVFEDQQGLIWFCTSDGLAMYDGYTLEYHRHIKGDSTSPSASWTYAGICDSKGRIWAGTAHGLSMMDRRTEKFVHFNYEPDNPNSLNHPTVRDILEDKAGRIYISTFGGACLFDEATHQFRRFEIPGFTGSRHTANFMEDRSGTVWVAPDTGLYRLDLTTMSGIQVLPMNNPALPRKAFALKNIYEDASGVFWLSADQGIWLYEPESKRFQQLEMQPAYKNRAFGPIVEYPEGYLLISAYSFGMLQWDIAARKVHRHFIKLANDLHSLTANSVYSFCRDSRDLLWIGTFNGVNKIDLGPHQFESYKNIEGSEDLRNYILFIYTDPQGGIWTNTMQGVFYRESLQQPAKMITGGPLRTPEYNFVLDFARASPDDLWMAIGNDGIYHLDIRTGIFQKINVLNHQAVGSEIHLLVQPNTPETLWVVYPDDLVGFDHHNGTTLRPDPPTGIKSWKNLSGICDGKDGTFWIWSDEMVWRYDPVKKYFQTYPLTSNGHEITPVLGLSGNQDQMWLATRNALFLLDQAKYQFEEIIQLDETIFAVQVDNKGRVWLRQETISQYDPVTKTLQTFRNPQNESFVNISFARLPDGPILTATAEGILAINPDHTQQDRTTPQVIMRHIKVNNQSVQLDASPAFVRHIPLHWDDKVITFEYAGLDFKEPGLVTYRLRLDGFEDAWREVGNVRDATYTNLAPGRYRFNVQAANANGIWGKTCSVDLRITPPYWKTIWFKTLLGILGLGLLFGGVRYYQYTLQLAKQKEIAEHSTQYKSMFLANMSHEIRTPMNAIVGISKLLSETQLNAHQKEYAQIIQQSAENLLIVINDILDYSKIESGKYMIVAKAFDLRLLMAQMVKIFEIKAVEKGISLETKMDPAIPDVIVGDANRLNQILMNLIGNALKFTQKGYIRMAAEVEAHRDENIRIQFSVADTGMGIPLEKQEQIFESFERVVAEGEVPGTGTGLGLSISKQLVEQQGGRIWLQSEPGRGTTFYFILTFSRASQDSILRDTGIEPRVIHQPLSFLVVEDTVFNQRLATELLKKYFPASAIDIAGNGQIALSRMADKAYDLILMDIKMPVMDGFETTRRIRQQEDGTLNPVQILAVTANVIPAQLEACREAGMNAYVTKPINGDELFNAIVRLLQLDT